MTRLNLCVHVQEYIKASLTRVSMQEKVFCIIFGDDCFFDHT
jgi:hypothetical protein